jgi:hypothetical protein
VVQTVDIRPGKSTSITITGAPEPSHRELWLYVWIALGALVVVATLGSVWKFRPRYEPLSDPRTAKELPVGMRPPPDYEPADFDRCSGNTSTKSANPRLRTARCQIDRPWRTGVRCERSIAESAVGGTGEPTPRRCFAAPLLRPCNTGLLVSMRMG